MFDVEVKLRLKPHPPSQFVRPLYYLTSALPPYMYICTLHYYTCAYTALHTCTCVYRGIPVTLIIIINYDIMLMFWGAS